MNLNLNQNQKQEQNQLKQNLKQFIEQSCALQPLEPQDQQSCCNSGDERFADYVKAGTKKPAGLTAEKLKTFPGLADLSEEDAQEIAETLISLSQLAYEMFQLKQANEPKEVDAKHESKKQQPRCNKTVAVGSQAKQQQKVANNAKKQSKVNRVTSKAIVK